MTAVVCLSVYAVIVAAYLVSNHRWHRSKPQPDLVFRIVSMYPPPIWPMKRPPVTQADIDSTWLDAWPTNVDEDDLMNREFVSLISETWDWTEPA